MSDRTREAERLQTEIREYILEMLSQLAAMAEQCRDTDFADILKRAAAEASPNLCTAV